MYSEGCAHLGDTHALPPLASALQILGLLPGRCSHSSWCSHVLSFLTGVGTEWVKMLGRAREEPTLELLGERWDMEFLEGR